MSDTLRLGLPLLDAAQAQKHVTVNEALARLDALAAGRVETAGQSTPPGSTDGTAHIIGAGATGAWAGQDNAVALASNGGWVFLAPWEGLTLWNRATATTERWRNGAWHSGETAASPGGGATATAVAEIDHALTSGTTSTTAALIPDKAVVTGVTARVIAAVTGPSSWSLGVGGSPDRYGSGYGTALNAFAHGVTSQPQAYYGATSLLISANGAAFTGGTLRIAVHYTTLTPPSTV